MSTLAIPPQRVRLYRQLWDRWIIVLRILFDLGAGAHPVKWQAVADTLLVDKNTAKKYLKGMIRDGQLAMAGEAYMLTSAGMSILQEFNDGGESFPLEGKNIGETFSPLKESVVVNDSELKQLTTTTSKLGKNPGESFSPLANLVFAHIPDLFGGSQLVLKGLMPWANDEILLGWIAYAYDRRTSLVSPVGLVYSKHKSEERPPMEYAKNYADFLPVTFLRDLGMVVPPEPVEIVESYELPPVEELSQAEELLQEMADRSREICAVCIGWSALSFDGGVLRIGVKNATLRDRWEDRIGTLAGRVLSDITGCASRVEFVVSVETEVDA
jgi:hypothetical protein